MLAFSRRSCAAECGDASFSPGDASADSSISAAEARDSALIAFSAVTDTAGLGVFRHQTGATGNKWFPENCTPENYIGIPSRFYHNDGDGTFTEWEPPAQSPLADSLVARGAAYGDDDRDGDVDVLLTENGGGAHLLRNDLRRAGGQGAALPAGDRAGAGYLRIKLRGRASNRDGIGAEVVAVADGKRMYRRVKTGSSSLSQSELAVSFGLGNARRVDSLRVAWPSGQTSRFTDGAAGQEVQVTEGAWAAQARFIAAGGSR